MDLSFEKQTLGMNLDFVDDFRDSELTIEVCIERKNKLIPAASRYVEFRDACEKLRAALAAELATWAYELCEVAPQSGPGRGGTGPLLNGYPIVQANPQERLTGALDASTGRLTMTQQSVLYGCSHAVQVELSHTVREIFAKKDKGCHRVRASFAHALGRAWARATAHPPSQATRSPRSPRSSRAGSLSLPQISPRQQRPRPAGGSKVVPSSPQAQQPRSARRRWPA